MPQSEGGYVSLGNGGPMNVYNSTTEPTTGAQSVFESVKRAIGQVVGNNGSQDMTPLTSKGMQPLIVGSRDRDKIGKTLNTKMPSAPAHTAEEARLLGTMPIDPMDDIELRSVQLQFPNARGSIVDSCDLRHVPTDKGDILVAIQGDASKPAIMTYHDLGLNYATSFAGFFNFPLMRGLLENFCVYHVTAPGQEEGAPTLPEDYVYPTMEELSAQLLFVMSHFGLKTVIGFGIGAGANILARFAIQNPDKVGALCIINCVSTASGWIEWGYQSFNARFLRTKGMTQSVVDYLMWHHFGRNPEERNHDLVQMYKAHFERGVNPTNLAMFINSYIHRTDLNIARTPPGTPQDTATLKMPVINITGALSPHVDDTVTLNGRLNPTNSTWMKISDCAMVLEEQPGKLAEAFRLFLQGEGYAVGALQRLCRQNLLKQRKYKTKRPLIINLAHLRIINLSSSRHCLRSSSLLLSSSPLTSKKYLQQQQQQRMLSSPPLLASLSSSSSSPISSSTQETAISMDLIKINSKPILVLHEKQSSLNTKFSTNIINNNTTATTTFINHDQLSKKSAVVVQLPPTIPPPPPPIPTLQSTMKMVNNNNILAFGNKLAPTLSSPPTTPILSGATKIFTNRAMIQQEHNYPQQQQQQQQHHHQRLMNSTDCDLTNGNFPALENVSVFTNINKDENRNSSGIGNNSTTTIGAIRITENPLPETVSC